jgi:hypothetical protein
MNGRWLHAATLVVACVVPAAALAACAKETSTGTTRPASSSAAPVAQPAASAPKAASLSAFGGTYTATAAQIDTGKGDKVVKWPPNPASGALGAGTIDLSAADPSGEVRGEAKGPLGDMVVSGSFDGHDLLANLTPKNPNADDAMTGVMTLVANGAALRGTLRVSGRDARVVREAAVELSRK